MASAELVGLTALTIEYVVGIALNLYILLVYIGNLNNGLSMGPSDKILFTKALVHVSLHVSMNGQNIIGFFWPHLFFKQEFLLSIIMIFMSLIIYSFWLTALLCVYYFSNITTWSHRVLALLKRSLLSYLLHVLLVSALGSVAISCPVFWFCFVESSGNSTHQISVMRWTFIHNVAYRIMSAILGLFLPLLIALVSTMLTSWSLINHMRRMYQNNWGFTRSKFQTQINATRTMVLFLLILVISSVVQIFFFSIPSSVPDYIALILWFIVISYPVPEAIIIIQSSVKFRRTLLSRLFDKKRGNKEDET
ncbi:taste receptor type 2 member 40-like [Dendrobates tinctorius]|uniref:taste receptor type 2 member 40-like n=1 Tax=Dendrobates tinctorius TaxID=92724 RepID=UPI003CCA242D